MEIKLAAFQSRGSNFSSFRDLYNSQIDGLLEGASARNSLAHLSRRKDLLNALLDTLAAEVDAPPQWAYLGNLGCVLIGSDSESYEDRDGRDLIRLDTCDAGPILYFVQHWNSPIEPLSVTTSRAAARETVRLMRELWNVDARLKPRF